MNKEAQRVLAQTVGRAIARRRVQAGYTQEQVAEKLGLGLGAVSRVEQGAAVPTIIRLIELAELFGCRLEELLSEVPATLDDRAAMIARSIAHLRPVDQAIVVELVKTLAEQFKEK
ncbi:helix-turn-helix domain-containing protein [Burkholderia multivorans]|uniref:helix-turn-helix domain-containing protein n=1 Tax=Burkholderia multivorans TaxID=87883 RepID=UPI00075B5C90|nr:helix-turn-helix transcriptional regulator [Burkholderia multivorans]KWH15127.1 DNA-binding protein [Burkholderia multivorans]